MHCALPMMDGGSGLRRRSARRGGVYEQRRVRSREMEGTYVPPNHGTILTPQLGR
jgi:hypothetical protein